MEDICRISHKLRNYCSTSDCTVSSPLNVLSVSVHGPPAAAPDASQAPAGPDLPATRPPATHPPLHLHPGPVSGPPLDPQVDRGCHRLPCHGEKRAAVTSPS